jgi:hypothetical protein
MPRGGKRPGAGAPKKLKPQPVGDKNAAARILAAVFGPKPHAADDCKCEKCWWWALMWAADLDLRERTGQKLYDKRDGKAVQTVNHLHDKPHRLWMSPGCSRWPTRSALAGCEPHKPRNDALCHLRTAEHQMLAADLGGFTRDPLGAVLYGFPWGRRARRHRWAARVARKRCWSTWASTSRTG